MAHKLASGPRIVVYINGKKYGRVVSIEITSSTPHRSIDGIDEVTPAELAPTRCKISGTIHVLRIVGDGGIEGVGVTTQFNNISKQKYFSLTLKDLGTDHTLFQINNCVVENQQWSMAAKSIVSGAFSFTGTTWSNETETSTF